MPSVAAKGWSSCFPFWIQRRFRRDAGLSHAGEQGQTRPHAQSPPPDVRERFHHGSNHSARNRRGFPRTFLDEPAIGMFPGCESFYPAGG